MTPNEFQVHFYSDILKHRINRPSAEFYYDTVKDVLMCFPGSDVESHETEEPPPKPKPENRELDFNNKDLELDELWEEYVQRVHDDS